MGLGTLVRLAVAGLVVAGCEAQPTGGFQPARFAASPSQPDLLVSFPPSAAAMASREAARLDAFVRGALLGPDDDVEVYVGQTGSAVLDARRLAALRAGFPATRARVKVFTALDAVGVTVPSDSVVVRTIAYDRITVHCPGNTAGPLELTTPLPEMTCSNAFNRATMAANPRDLISPEEFGGTSPTLAAAAVKRQAEGKVAHRPIGLASVVGD